MFDEKTIQKRIDYEKLPIEVLKVEEDKNELNIYLSFYKKAYGDSYTVEKEFTSKRYDYTSKDNGYSFDLPIDEDLSSVLFAIGLVKQGSNYPTKIFSGTYGYTDLTYKTIRLIVSFEYD